MSQNGTNSSIDSQDLPTGWEQKPLSHVLQVLETGSRPKGGVRGIDSGVPSVGGEHLHASGGFDFSTTRFVSDSFYKEMRRGKILKGDVLVVKDGATTGKTSIVSTDFPFDHAAVNEHVFILRTNEEMSSRYLFWFLWSSEGQRQILSNFRGAAQGGITRGFADGVSVPFPSREEQDQIVTAIEDLLNQVDAGEVSLREARRRALIQRDLAYSSVLQGPWPTAQLRELLREPLRNGHSAKASPDGKGIRTLKLTAVTVGQFTDSNTKITTADPGRVKDLWLEPGDILIERSNTPELVGTAALYRGERQWAIFPDLLIRVRVSDELLPEFLELVLKERTTRRYFRQAAQGIAGSMPKIDQEAVLSLLVPLPEMRRQQEIVARLNRQLAAIEQSIDDIDKAGFSSDGLRDAVLRHAFTGRLGRALAGGRNSHANSAA